MLLKKSQFLFSKNTIIFKKIICGERILFFYLLSFTVKYKKALVCPKGNSDMMRQYFLEIKEISYDINFIPDL